MKQTLQLRIGQHLTMTPQLQQAIRLLQLSTLELQVEVQDALESNPMLEQDEGNNDAPETDPAASSTAQETSTPAKESEGDNIPEDLPIDSSWEDVFDTGATIYSAGETDSGRDLLEKVTASSANLRDHLVWQMEMT
ncbi:MAG: RNA polymerase factor sigma-54, partial [Gammaproteobacteria bacterium]|nr:RNA polymerase factor sigma-54 [Gammaproteobacteria bacterium]